MTEGALLVSKGERPREHLSASGSASEEVSERGAVVSEYAKVSGDAGVIAMSGVVLVCASECECCC